MLEKELYHVRGSFVHCKLNLNTQQSELSAIGLANIEALASEDTDCTALGNCSSTCPYEWCGYCKGIYMMECPQPQY
ncbi:MAG: hypothetical protein LBK58_06115 [Prevotellaceae bacterium]|jgi:hypothetical protein|nr:hypothetical protein [Prevotellaceae bacterium]